MLFHSVNAFGEIQTITHTVKQVFGGSQSPDDAKIVAVAKAKREALELAGTYIESTTIVRNSSVAKDEIIALSAGILEAEVISQKNFICRDSKYHFSYSTKSNYSNFPYPLLILKGVLWD